MRAVAVGGLEVVRFDWRRLPPRPGEARSRYRLLARIAQVLVVPLDRLDGFLAARAVVDLESASARPTLVPQVKLSIDREPTRMRAMWAAAWAWRYPAVLLRADGKYALHVARGRERRLEGARRKQAGGSNLSATFGILSGRSRLSTTPLTSTAIGS